MFFFQRLLEAAFQNTQLEHAFGRNPYCRFVHMFPGVARTCLLNGLELRSQHHLVQVFLWSAEFTVDREGYVFVPEVGQVFVNGLNLEALEKKFFQILSKVYSTLKPATGKPSTFMDISLGNLRPLRIIVLGEVGQPGAYSVSPSTSLSSSLYYFHGPTTMGSLRDIRLLRKNKLIGSIDFYAGGGGLCRR